MRKYSFVFVCLCVFVVGVALSIHAQGKTYLPVMVNSAHSEQAYVQIANREVAVKLDASQESAVITFDPATGQPGDTITIHGAHFVSVVAVLFGTTPATYHVIDETTLSAIVPDDAMTGNVTVIMMASSGQPFVVGEPATTTPIVPATATPNATATNTPVPGETVTPIPPTTKPTATPGAATATGTPSTSKGGIWISQAEIDALPMTGAGWDEVKAAADSSPGSPSLSNQDSDNNVMVLAEALVCARTHTQSYCDRVETALKVVITGNLESGARALALGRELAAYVIAADVINLKTMDPATDAQFRTKIKALLSFNTTSGPANLIACDQERPNNWGGHCGASRIAVDLYLGDKVDLDRASLVFRGWLGNRAVYSGFTYGALDWQADPSKPVGVNPLGAMLQGHPVGGGQPEELRRAGSVHWPPTFTDYGWEGLQGRLASAVMLSRAGYDSWNWSDKGLLRAVQFLYDIKWPAVGDDQWQIWIVNKAYGANFPTTGGGKGKNVGWTQFTAGK